MLYHVALGSNLGDRLARLRDAVSGLGAFGQVLARSSVWETAPVDAPPGAGDFLNAAVALESELAPLPLLAALLALERRLGRDRRTAPLRNAPRTIDLDVLLAGDLVLDAPGLRVPHPRLHQRAFVLAPLAEIAPVAIHPVLHRSIAALLAALPPAAQRVRRLAALP